MYCFGDEESFHKALKVSDSFSQLLMKTVSSSRSLSLSLDDSAKLEACICGQIQSQSFWLWALTAVFEFLKDSNCIPEGPVFHQLVTSMTDAINPLTPNRPTVRRYEKVFLNFRVKIFCNLTLPEYLISTLPHPHRTYRHTHRQRKRKKSPNNPSYCQR